MLVVVAVGAITALLLLPMPGSEVGTPSSQSATPTIDGGDRDYIVLPLAIPPRKPDQAVAPPVDPEETFAWLEHIVQPGDTLSGIFSRLSVPARDLLSLLGEQDRKKALSNIVPGQTFRIRLDEDGRLAELRYREDQLNEMCVTRKGDGFATKLVVDAVERRTAHASGVIAGSLFAAAQKAGMSDRLTMELADIFGWDIDFALDLREGDSFTVVYEELYKDGERIGEGDILSAEFSNRGDTFRAVRFDEPDGTATYYTPEGRSMRKAFLRTPVKFSRISSGFNLRRKHPILNRIRAHKGVDYAAPRGTPVLATADGKITFRKTKGGYGRTVIVDHSNGYSTLYAHLSRYASAAKAGQRVKQGQVIGYVGSSGLATGPHLHYEFRLNGAHKNPLTVKLPQAESVAKARRAEFDQKTHALLAQLELVRQANLIASN
ncbi:MAG: peptidoglycan DD-metalloendopeptidase family protein [Chromatiales bacterium]|nr:peptidoglycan DD-metalloendopeptidase family protein [Chromatiales bacterium]